MVDINELEYGDYVSVNNELFLVFGEDFEKRTASLVPVELLDQYAHDEDQLYAHAISVPARKIDRIFPVHVEESVLRALFRLEVTPWALVAENKYPFSTATKQYEFTEDDLLCFLDNLNKINSAIVVDAWSSNFSGQGVFDFIRWPELKEPGVTLYFLWKKVCALMDWLDYSEDSYDDWSYIFDVRDAYLKSKNLPIEKHVIPDDFKGDLLANIEEYAAKHPIDDRLRKYYAQLLDEVACPDDEEWLKNKAYAYYGGNGIVPCDWKKSEEALLQAFDIAGDPYVANSLGYIYYSDRLGKPDYEKAFYYFNYACYYGVTEATYKLSDLYRHGHGVERNPKKAWQLLSMLYERIDKRRKHRNKYPDICLRIGYCYRDGIGVEKDMNKALEFFYNAKDGIIARIKKDKGFGDEQVLKNVWRAIEDIEIAKNGKTPVSYIRLLFDYPCYPVWLYAEDGCVIDTDLPDEWQDDKELDSLFLQLQEAYGSLFIDDGKEFSYIGFSSDEERSNFENLMTAAVNALNQKNNGKYRIVNDLNY